jgi:hypothetical protein
MTGLENLEAAGGEFYFNADGELFAADPVTNALTPVSELPAPPRVMAGKPPMTPHPRFWRRR